MTVYAITDTKKGEQGLRLLIFKLPTKRNKNITSLGGGRIMLVSNQLTLRLVADVGHVMRTPEPSS